MQTRTDTPTQDAAHVEPLVAVRDLTVDFWSGGAYQAVVRRVSFAINRGETLGLVGESGSGKSTTVNALLGYHHPASRLREGSVRFQGVDILRANALTLQRMRGRDIGFVPQDPATALTPNMRVGDQILESLRVHTMLNSSGAQDRLRELLAMVGLPAGRLTARKYPHQMSGGQQQRVAIAIALACAPALLVLDEPTTGLDVTTQAQILDLLARLRTELRLSIVFVSHDLSVIATICDHVGVMYAGELVEIARRDTIFDRPRHPYTRALIAAVPRVHEPAEAFALRLPGMLRREALPVGCKFAPRCAFSETACFEVPQVLAPIGPEHAVACRRQADPTLRAEPVVTSPAAAGGSAGTRGDGGTPALAVRDLSCSYRRRRSLFARRQQAELVVKNVSFSVAAGETFALVGESGSGKSTIAKAIAGIVPAVSGDILLQGQPLPTDLRRRSRQLLRHIQIIPQNPYASLNPRHAVEAIVGRPLHVFFGLNRKQRRAKAVQMLSDVRLDASYLRRSPRQLSGGERQRVAIARALAASPAVLLCDEILSALDVSVQAGVRDLLHALQAEHGMTYLFISHDLAVVRSLAHSVGVLFRGQLCEMGRVNEVYEPPYHPYVSVLLAAVPDLDRRAVADHQRVAATTAGTREPACPFAVTCPWKIGPICENEAPPWRQVSPTHQLRCHYALPDLLRLETRSARSAAEPTGDGEGATS